jgi:PAS domain S-box-containing protein
MQKPEATNVEQEVRNIDLIVSKSDEEGNITYVNPIFMKISGYTQGELYDKPHSILRHPDMPKAIFGYLWKTLKEGDDVIAFVKNLCKDGSFYWVLATVKTAKNPDGSFRNYMSTRKTMSENAKSVILPLYAKLLEEEKVNGEDASYAMFEAFLSENNISNAAEFNVYMQNLNK